MNVVWRLEFWVPGLPQPQGSKTAFVVNGRAVVVDKNPKLLKPWREAVAAAAAESWRGREPLEGPLRVDVEFRLERGATVKRELPSVRPDLDKLERALLDGIGQAQKDWGVSIWRDDAQVVQLHGRKVYADRAGAWVRVGVMREEQP